MHDNAESLLFLACYRGHEDILKLFLQYDCMDVNKEDAHGNTPLWIACDKGFERIAKILFASGRKIHITKKHPTMPTEISNLIKDYEKSPTKLVLKLRNEMGLDIHVDFDW